MPEIKSWVLLIALTGRSGWMRPPGRRCWFSVRCPAVVWWVAWCNLHPGNRTDGSCYTWIKLWSNAVKERRPVPGREPCSECWWSYRSCPSQRRRRTTWGEDNGAVSLKRVATVVRWDSHLHVNLGVVDEILQRVSARVVVLELCVVGDGADGGVMGPDHPTDVDRLDVGEVGEYSCPWCAGGLRCCTAYKRLQLTHTYTHTLTLWYWPWSYSRRHFPLRWGRWISPPAALRICPASHGSLRRPRHGWGSEG